MRNDFDQLKNVRAMRRRLDWDVQQVQSCHRVQGCQGYRSFPVKWRSEVRERPCCWSTRGYVGALGKLTLAPGRPGSPVRPDSPVEPLAPATPGGPRSPVAPCEWGESTTLEFVFFKRGTKIKIEGVCLSLTHFGSSWAISTRETTTARASLHEETHTA